MSIQILSQKDFSTGLWSGGSTTQMAIYPPSENYSDRNFLWRISSATVEQETSSFTPLPDYHRIISTLKGSVSLSHEENSLRTLSPGELYFFDGGAPTVSRGKCTDFNVMMRKGACCGFAESTYLTPGTLIQRSCSNPFPSFPHHRMILFCPKASLLLIQDGNSTALPTGCLAIIDEPYEAPLSIAMESSDKRTQKDSATPEDCLFFIVQLAF